MSDETTTKEAIEGLSGEGDKLYFEFEEWLMKMPKYSKAWLVKMIDHANELRDKYQLLHNLQYPITEPCGCFMDYEDTYNCLLHSLEEAMREVDDIDQL